MECYLLVSLKLISWSAPLLWPYSGPWNPNLLDYCNGHQSFIPTTDRKIFLRCKSDHVPVLLRIFQWLPSSPRVKSSSSLTRHTSLFLSFSFGPSSCSLPHSLMILCCSCLRYVPLGYLIPSFKICDNTKGQVPLPQASSFLCLPLLSYHFVCISADLWALAALVLYLFCPSAEAKCDKQDIIPDIVEGAWIWVVKGICQSKSCQIYWHDVIHNFPFFSF